MVTFFFLTLWKAFKGFLIASMACTALLLVVLLLTWLVTRFV